MSRLALLGSGPTGTGESTDPYMAVVNSLTAPVIAYWPGTLAGTTVLDASGNGRTGTAENITPDDGLLGDAIRFSGASDSGLYAEAGLRGAIDQDEFCVSMIVKCDLNGAIVPRLYNQYGNSAAEYIAMEIRTASGNRLDMYLREGGVNAQWTEFALLQDLEWFHVVMFNSKSQGQFGLYFNRLYLPIGRALAGVTPGIDSPYPEVGYWLDGWIQHIVWMDTGIPSQADVDALYYGAFDPASSDITTIFSDTFDGNESAPLATPRASGLAITDTGNYMSIVSGQLSWSQKTTNNVDPRVMSGSQSRKQGRALLGYTTPGSVYVGWDDDGTGSPTHESFLFQSGSIFAMATNAQFNLGAAASSNEYKVAIIMRRYGADWLVKGGAYTEWTRIFVSSLSAAARYAGLGTSNQNSATTANALMVKDLPAPFNRDFDLATSRLAGGRTAGDTFTHTADCIINFTLTTRPSVGSIDFRFRVQDANNYWQVLVSTTGATTLNEVVAGTPTSRGTGTPGMNAGHVAIIICAGSTIYGISQTTSSYAFMWTAYTSATNFATETDGELASLATGGLVSDIVAWPRTLGESAVTILDEATS